MAPIRGVFDCLLLRADVPEEIVDAFLPTKLQSGSRGTTLVFELGRQKGAGLPFFGLDFQEAKVQIPGVQIDGHDFTFKSVLWFSSQLMRMASSATGLRSVHANFSPPKFTTANRDQFEYSVQGVVEASVWATEGKVDLQEIERLMCSPWIGGATGPSRYQHIYDFEQQLSPPRAVEGNIRLFLPSCVLQPIDAASSLDGWYEVKVTGFAVHAPWRLDGPHRRIQVCQGFDHLGLERHRIDPEKVL